MRTEEFPLLDDKFRTFVGPAGHTIGVKVPTVNGQEISFALDAAAIGPFLIELMKVSQAAATKRAQTDPHDRKAGSSFSALTVVPQSLQVAAGRGPRGEYVVAIAVRLSGVEFTFPVPPAIARDFAAQLAAQASASPDDTPPLN